MEAFLLALSRAQTRQIAAARAVTTPYVGHLKAITAHITVVKDLTRTSVSLDQAIIIADESQMECALGYLAVSGVLAVTCSGIVLLRHRLGVQGHGWAAMAVKMSMIRSIAMETAY